MIAETTADFNGAQSTVKTGGGGAYMRITPRKHDTPLALNRAQRRALARHIRHKAAPYRQTQRMLNGMRGCPRCHRDFFVPQEIAMRFAARAVQRCHCQVEQRHACALCGAIVMASQRVWRKTNVCPGCAEQLREQWASEAESASEAQERWYRQREWDDQQHRVAREAK